MPNRFVTALACTVWLTATAAMTQTTAPAGRQPDNGPSGASAASAATPVSPLTVQAPPNRKALEKQARGFVESYAAPTVKLGQYARWAEPACVAVTGLIPEQAAPVRARVEQVALAVGEPVGPPGCTPNIEIWFTAEPQRDLEAIAARNPAVLGTGDAKTVTHPIQAWYATATEGSPAVPRGPISAPPPAASIAAMAQSTATDRFRVNRGALAPRRCIDARSPTCPHSAFLNVLVLVDAGRMGDVSLALTSDYVAILALSQPRSLDGCLPLPSVIDLYARACPGRAPPSGLTPADMAYLTSLYAADLTASKSSEQADIAKRMTRILAVPTRAPAPNEPAKPVVVRPSEDVLTPALNVASLDTRETPLTTDAAAFVSQMVTDAKATEVSGVEVVAKRKSVSLSGVEVNDPVRCLPPRRPADKTVPAPKLVSTYPANGETVQPGYIVLRLTFDLPMACRGSVSTDLLSGCVSTALSPGVGIPTQVWRETYDRRTLLILCKLKPGTYYEMRFNRDKIWEHFQGLSGREPRASRFAFRTSDEPAVMTVAGLVDRDPGLRAVVKRVEGR